MVVHQLHLLGNAFGAVGCFSALSQLFVQGVQLGREGTVRARGLRIGLRLRNLQLVQLFSPDLVVVAQSVDFFFLLADRGEQLRVGLLAR